SGKVTPFTTSQIELDPKSAYNDLTALQQPDPNAGFDTNFYRVTAPGALMGGLTVHIKTSDPAQSYGVQTIAVWKRITSGNSFSYTLLNSLDLDLDSNPSIHEATLSVTGDTPAPGDQYYISTNYWRPAYTSVNGIGLLLGPSFPVFQSADPDFVVTGID